jgi:hypothetical protein
MASARKATRVASAATNVSGMANGAAAYGPTMFKVVIPMMISPKSAKNSHIRPIIIKITRRIIRSVVTRGHDPDASGQGHQKRPTE